MTGSPLSPPPPTADILVHVNDVCMLGVSHSEAVEMLKSVPVGHGVDVEVRRGYPMLYDYDGVPKHPPAATTAQPWPRLPASAHFDLEEVCSDGGYTEPGPMLDFAPLVTRQPPSYRRLSANAAFSSPPAHHPRSPRARLQSLDPALASQSDSEVVSAIGSHR